MIQAPRRATHAAPMAMPIAAPTLTERWLGSLAFMGLEELDASEESVGLSKVDDDVPDADDCDAPVDVCDTPVEVCDGDDDELEELWRTGSAN